MRALPASLMVALVMVLSLAPAAPSAAQQQELKIYRCTDADGRVALRDTPCPTGHEQKVRTMQRPKDAPTPTVVVPPEPEAAPPPAPQPVERVVVLRTPQPMYECTTPDGDSYTSDTAAGNPRWVPLWTLGYPTAVPRGTRPPLAITGGTVRLGDGGATLRRPGVAPAWMAGAGTWIRDTCHPLPQAEVCNRLRDERDEIRRKFFNAMPSEREVLRVEERGVNARLDADCRTY